MIFGILCAMEEEIKDLKAVLKNEKVTDIHGLKFYAGQINDQDVVLVQSGIGKVEAGIATALLITNLNADVVINTGSAGGIGKGLSVGDVVVSTETAYHDADSRVFGYDYGQLPGQPQLFKADEKWIDQILTAAKATDLNTHKGLIVSGDQFISSKEQTDRILKHFPDALSCEMESAAVGQVAHQFDTPYVVIRAMSDTADEQADQSFDEFVIDAGHRSAQMMIHLLANQK